jgi:hypothetical protein
LISEHMIDKGRARVSVSTDCHALVHAIGGVTDNVVELIGHTTRLGNISDRALAIKLRGYDVVHHAASISNLERTRLDASDGGGADNGDTLLLRNMKDFTSTLI